ncbi:MAG: lipoyl(octanoyl) transferase LipB [Ignavibacteria bacterium]|jgi:lipoyl(octanoyl) transferase|nr:lipoyl(octanoyl) transferase LipB [Ignavibacteria bacterium]
MKKLEIQSWGLIDYEEAWDRQRQIVQSVKNERGKSVLVFCQHPTVITIGRSGDESSLLFSKDFLTSKGVKVVLSDRGGDATLHNPLQLVGYPIFDLSSLKEDLHWFLRSIENCIILALKKYNIEASTVEGLTGVWIETQRKICAIGLHCSNWVSSHGFALNVSNNLNEFNYIVPCGIKNKAVTSISQEIGTEVDINAVERVCENIFLNWFETI